jgi:D-lactate dehydrogenase
MHISLQFHRSERWMNYEVLDNAMRIRCQPGLVGQRVNDILAPYGRKIGPDPASINAVCLRAAVYVDDSRGGGDAA